MTIQLSGSKVIPGFRGKYEVTRCGEVWSNIIGIFLKQRIQRTGYVVVKLAGKNRSVHRLVAATYLENNTNRPTVNHINGIKTDNRVENLEWATMQEQALHALATGLRIPEVGEDAGPSKLTTVQVLEIRAKYSNGATQRVLGDEYLVSPSNISHIVRGSVWKHLPTDGQSLLVGRSRSAAATRSLRPEIVRELRLKHQAGRSIKGLGIEYGIPYSTLNGVLNFRTYADFDTDLRKAA